MTKQLGLMIVATFVLSIGVVLFLAALSKDMRQQPGSFLREFPPHPALEAEILDLKYNSYYIAGGTGHHVYLANYSAPLHMIVANSTLTDTQHVKLDIKGIMDQKFWSPRIKVDSPFYYFADGVIPIIYKGNVHDWQAERYTYDKVYFQDIIPIANESFFIRSLSSPERENILGKITTDTPHIQMKRGILQKQVDGVFCTDGMMHYEKKKNELIYLYRYRNEFIVMDTSLNVLTKYNTIDTTTRANIKVGTIESSRSTTFASPSHMVNKQSSVSGNFLFVNSMLLAKNEPPSAHDDVSVIDVYNLQNGSYLLSFYMYDLKGKKLRELSVYEDKIFALFDTYIQVWHLNPKHFPVRETTY
jgi:hypothetical protein